MFSLCVLHNIDRVKISHCRHIKACSCSHPSSSHTSPLCDIDAKNGAFKSGKTHEFTSRKCYTCPMCFVCCVISFTAAWYGWFSHFLIYAYDVYNLVNYFAGNCDWPLFSLWFLILGGFGAVAIFWECIFTCVWKLTFCVKTVAGLRRLYDVQ